MFLQTACKQNTVHKFQLVRKCLHDSNRKRGVLTDQVGKCTASFKITQTIYKIILRQPIMISYFRSQRCHV